MKKPLAILKQDNQNNDDRRDVYEPDYIPYACHYNPHTLLTKNGELLQTIKIVGFATEIIGSKKIKLREAVREAMFASLPGNDYALWFHTIRRQHDLTPAGEYPEGFAKLTHERWTELHGWNKKFTNELYVTIVRDGQEVKISDPTRFGRALWPPAHRKYRLSYLERAYHELDATVTKMLGVLESYGAHRLSIVEKPDRVQSEILEFLGKILNLEDTSLAIPVVDISEYLPSKDIAFGFNVMEVRGTSSRNFGAILTIKEYKELTANSLDSFLQLPQEMIISECVDFINGDKVKETYNYQKYITDLSEDTELAQMSGLNDIFASDKGRPIDYGQHQLCVMLVNETVQELEQSVGRAVDTLANLGIVSMREDMRLEECYWSMLPGNFPFVTRLHQINTARVGGFASLHNFPAGRPAGNHWGPAACVFYTAAGTPYFFNFHHKDNGHTTIIGPHGAGKTVLLNFLCAQAQKFQPRMFFFDKDKGSEIFLKALGGHYLDILADSKSGSLRMNPLLLPPSDATTQFLTEWLWSLLTATGATIDTPTITILQTVMHHLQTRPESERRLSTVATLLEQAGVGQLIPHLAPWHSGGEWACLFDHATHNLDFTAHIQGFEMGELIATKTPLGPTLLYLLYLLSTRLDGTPTILVLDEAWEMLDNPLFAPKIGPLLALLRSQNTIAILATESVETASQSRINADLMQHISTEFYLPNPKASSAYQDVFHLNDKEFRLLHRMLPERRHLLLKHAGDAIVAELNLASTPDLLAVFSPNPRQHEIFNQIPKASGSTEWLPHYLSQAAAKPAGGGLR